MLTIRLYNVLENALESRPEVGGTVDRLFSIHMHAIQHTHHVLLCSDLQRLNNMQPVTTAHALYFLKADFAVFLEENRKLSGHRP